MSEDGLTLVVSIVNPTDTAVESSIQIAGFVPSLPIARLTELTAERDATNTAKNSHAVQPRDRDWTHAMIDGGTTYVVPPYSITMMRFESRCAEGSTEVTEEICT